MTFYEITPGVVGVISNILECFSSDRLQPFLKNYLPRGIKPDFDDLFSGWTSPKNLPAKFFERLSNYPNHQKIINDMIPTLLNASPSQRCSEKKLNNRIHSLKEILGQGDESSILVPLIEPTVQFESDLYNQIIEEINGAYQAFLFNATFILMRKLLENLLIDCLRNYHKSDIDHYFLEDKGMFLPLSALIDNFNTMIRRGDFISRVQKIPQSNIDLLKKLKGEGDSSAHSLFSLPTRSIIEKNREEINNLLILLKEVKNRI